MCIHLCIYRVKGSSNLLTSDDGSRGASSVRRQGGGGIYICIYICICIYFSGQGLAQRLNSPPESNVFQMMARAGRPQYNDKAVAVILGLTLTLNPLTRCVSDDDLGEPDICMWSLDPMGFRWWAAQDVRNTTTSAKPSYICTHIQLYIDIYVLYALCLGLRINPIP